MKFFLSTILSVITLTVLFAQTTDSIAPKWQVGQVWKVSSSTFSPNSEKVKERIIEMDTTYAQFMWEVVKIEDSTVTFSIIPLKLDFISKNENSIEESNYVKDAFDVLYQTKTPLLYQTDLYGRLKKIENKKENEENIVSEDSVAEENIVEDEVAETEFVEEVEEELEDNIFNMDIPEKKHYFINDSTLRNIWSQIKTADSENNESLKYMDADIRYWAIVEFFDKLIETIHSPFGEAIILDSIVDIKDYPKEKWESYQSGLSSMVKMMDVSGNVETKYQDNGLIYNFDMNMNLGEMMRKIFSAFGEMGEKNKKSKKTAKKLKEEMDSFKMEIKINGNYLLDKETMFPIHYTTDTYSDISSKDEAVKMNSINILVFE